MSDILEGFQTMIHTPFSAHGPRFQYCFVFTNAAHAIAGEASLRQAFADAGVVSLPTLADEKTLGKEFKSEHPQFSVSEISRTEDGQYARIHSGISPTVALVFESERGPLAPAVHERACILAYGRLAY